MQRQLQQIRGMHVVSLAEGRILGVVQKVFVNSTRKKVSGLTVRGAGLGSAEGWVDVRDVTQVGEDVVFVSRAASCKAKMPVGRSLRDMMGMPVTTRRGKIIGSLVDVEVDDGWKLSELSLSDRRVVPVGKQAVFGQDTIILGAGAEQKIRRLPRNRPGILSRIFGREMVEEAADVIARAEQAAVHVRPPTADKAKPRPRRK